MYNDAPSCLFEFFPGSINQFLNGRSQEGIFPSSKSNESVFEMIHDPAFLEKLRNCSYSGIASYSSPIRKRQEL